MKIDKTLRRLLLDYDYDVQGGRIIQKGIRGFTSDRVWGRCRSVFDACEQLIPVIHDRQFTTRFIKVTA
jgi:hypothetical protein